MNKPITLCDRCDNAFHCLLNYDGKPCRENRTVEPTNADRIRSMTDEELANFMEETATWGGCPNHGARDCTSDCGLCWAVWLKAPVEEVDE